MKKKSKRLLTLFMSLATLLSLISPAIGTQIAAAEQTAEERTTAQTPDLRVGILSDVHIGFLWNQTIQTTRFRKALGAFKEMGVDAVIVAGDLQDISGQEKLEEQKAWMEEFANVWFEVFPADSGVEPVFIYGNHDVDLIAAEYWPESLGSYTNAFLKEINGYQFVGVHNGKEGEAVVDTYIAEAASASEGKPFFYIQHCPIHQTVPGSIGGYGAAYSQAGRANLEKYSNAVAFSGHTHLTLADERSIWQGSDWMDGQFTVVNTATINYSWLGYVGTGMETTSVAVNGSSGDTQQGMYMTVTGSEVTIDRYSFTESEAVKFGQTWSFDACDEGDRPYTYENRYEAAAAPTFADGATITVDKVQDTSVTVTFPAASLASVEGYSDMIHSYVVEAVDPVTGVVMASGAVGTEHHIDDDTSRFSDAYTVSINGLEAGREYILKAYALEFFQKRSTPLTATITTTGTANSGKTGDVDGNGSINAEDLTVLKQIHAGTAQDTQWSDVDGNNVKESADITALENILAGKLPVSEDASVDALGNSTYHKLINTSGSAWSYDVQTAVTNGGTGVALKAASTDAAGWPHGVVYFDEPLDWSQSNQLSFDTLFVNEPVLAQRWLAVTLISGEQMQSSSTVSLNQPEAWTNRTLNFSQFTNVDFSDIRGIYFSYNMASYEGRYDGTTEHAVYIDNVTTGYTTLNRPDSDLLGTAVDIVGGERRQSAGEIAGNGSAESVMSTDSTVNITLANTYNFWFYEFLKLKVKMVGSGNVTVQALDTDGNLIGNAVKLATADGKWCSNAVRTDALGLEKSDVVAGLCFCVADGTVYLDNMSLTERSDDDLLANSSIFWSGVGGTTNLIGYMQSQETNGSYFAAKIEVVETATTSAWPRIYLTLPENIDPDVDYISLDAKLDGAMPWIGVHALNKNDSEIGSQIYQRSLTGWNNYLFRLSDLGVTDANVDQVKRIFISLKFDSANSVAGDCVYVDNVRYIQGDNDLMNATTSITYNNGGANFHSRPVAVGTNNSNMAIYTEGVYGASSWPQVYFNYDEPIDLTQNPYITYDFKVENAHHRHGIFIYAADKTTKLAEFNIDAPNAVGKWQNCAFSIEDHLVSGATMDDLKSVGRIVYWNNAASATSYDDATKPRQLWLDNLVAYDPSADVIADSVYTPAKPDSGTDFYSKVIDETADGRTNVLYIYNNPTGGAYTGQWPGPFKFTSRAGSFNLTNREYLEYDIKFSGMHYWIDITLQNSNGTEIGTIIFDMNTNSDWQHYRIPLSSIAPKNGYTSAEQVLAEVATIGFIFNWTKQVAASGAVTGEVSFDNVRFTSTDDDDLLSVSQEYAFASGHTNESISWTMQNDVTFGSDEAIMVTKNHNITDKIEWPAMFFWFNVKHTPIDMSGFDTLTIDLRAENVKTWVSVALIDKNKNVYTYTDTASVSFDWDPPGQWVRKEFDLSKFVKTDDGTVIDPSQIAGIRFEFNPGTTITTNGVGGGNVNKTKLGVWYIDNVRAISTAVQDASLNDATA